MRVVIAAAVALGGAWLMPAPASAAGFPVNPPGVDSGAIELVRDGCGRGWRRNRWGECRPMFRRGPPPGFYMRAQRCWREMTPWGPRRVCRRVAR